MKVQLFCPTCSDGVREQPVIVEIEDEGVYTVECERGHRTLHTVSNPKFEILFELALLALADGYTREAVATLAATVEEFFRLFIKTVLFKNRLYEGALYEEAKRFWKHVDRAEPQLGAFMLAYFLEKRKVATFPDQASISFRNGVIHRGRIPKFQKVVEYGDKIVSFLAPLYAEYRRDFHIMIAGALDQVDVLMKKNEPSSGASGYATAMQYLTMSPGQATFAAAVDYAKRGSFLRTAK